MMKTIYLLRHAKSSWKLPELPDHERPLNGRGLRAAPEMGRRLAQRGWRPDSIISSTAVRAISTARLVAEALDFRADEIQLNAGLYFQGCRPMLRVLRSLPDRQNSAMLVGHNPDLTTCINVLTGLDWDDVPTAAVAVIEFDTSFWGEVLEGKGRLVAYDFPKQVKCHP